MERHQSVQRMDSYSKSKNGAVFHCRTNEDNAIDIEVIVCTPYILRLRMCPDPALLSDANLLDIREEWPGAPFDIDEQQETVEIDTGALRFVAQKGRWEYSIRNRAGETLVAEHVRDLDAHANFRNLPLGFTTEEGSFPSCNETFYWTPGEAIYGFGEKFTRLNKVGQTIVGWNKNPYGAGTEEAYKNIPFLVSTQGYGIFINTVYPVTYHVVSRSLASTSLTVHHAVLDLFFIYGPHMKDTLGRYASITGWPALPPLESFGIWHTPQLWVEKTPEKIAAVAREFRERDIPVDYFMAATLSLGGIEDSTDWTQAVSEKLDELAVKTGMYIAPLLNLGSELEQEARTNGYALMGEDGEPYEIPLGYRTDEGERGEAEYSLAALTRDNEWRDRHNRLFYTPCLMPDFTNPATVHWWKEKIKAHVRAGAFGIAMSDFGEDVPVDARFHNGRSGLEMHNLYTLLYQKATFEAVEEASNHRGLVNARSGTAGMQRYPICWSGDPNCTWEDMLADLRAGLCLGLSGVPFWSCDNGGYSATTGNLTPELWMRWSQWSMFQSHVRLHGIEPPRVPWLFGERSTANFRRYAKLRYRLLPYIYSHAYLATQTGLPLMRAMVLEYTDDPNTYEMDDQYMFGDAFLVAPVYSPTGRRSVYLPAGKWYDYWTGAEIMGPTTLHIEPALEELPLYVRGDSIIIMGPDMAYVGERPFDPIMLDVWLEDEAVCTLFDDSDGEPHLVECHARRRPNQMMLEVSASRRRYVAKFNHAGQPSTVTLDGTTLPRAGTFAELEQMRFGWFFDTSFTVYAKFAALGGHSLLRLQY